MKTQQKWPPEKRDELTRLCIAGTSNKDLAAHFGVPLAEIHGVRSALGITIDKCKAMRDEQSAVTRLGRPKKQDLAKAPAVDLSQVSTLMLIQALIGRGVATVPPADTRVVLISSKVQP